MSSINIAGGFVMTSRMLAMFRRPGDLPEYTHLYALPAVAIPGAYLGALGLGVDNPSLHTMAGLAASLMCFGGIAGLSSQVPLRCSHTRT